MAKLTTEQLDAEQASVKSYQDLMQLLDNSEEKDQLAILEALKGRLKPLINKDDRKLHALMFLLSSNVQAQAIVTEAMRSKSEDANDGQITPLAARPISAALEQGLTPAELKQLTNHSYSSVPQTRDEYIKSLLAIDSGERCSKIDELDPRDQQRMFLLSGGVSQSLAEIKQKPYNCECYQALLYGITLAYKAQRSKNPAIYFNCFSSLFGGCSKAEKTDAARILAEAIKENRPLGSDEINLHCKALGQGNLGKIYKFYKQHQPGIAASFGREHQKSLS